MFSLKNMAVDHVSENQQLTMGLKLAAASPRKESSLLQFLFSFSTIIDNFVGRFENVSNVEASRNAIKVSSS